MASQNTSNNYRIPFIALTSLFFMWGFITVIVDAFVPRLREVFELSFTQAGLVQFAWFTAYLLISIPAGYLVSRLSYKKGIIIGLAIAGLGCLLFIPAASTRLFPFFLLALFTLASGITILQVAANPFVSVLGPEEQASSRLNLAQAFNSLGTTIAPVFAATYLLSDNIKTSGQIEKLSEAAKESYFLSEASAVQSPFLYIALFLFVLATAFAFIKLPNILSNDNDKTYSDALSFSNLRLGIIAIFVYVGAEVSIGSYLVDYFVSMDMDKLIPQNSFMRNIASFLSSTFSGKELSEINPKGIVGTFVLFYWGGAMVGRFIGSFLTRVFNPGKILALFTLSAVTLLFLTMFTDKFIAMWTVLGIGLFNSIMFPTIFTLSIDGLGDAKPQGSGLLCTAIFGGAIIPPLFGFMTDSFGFKIAFIVPIVCYLYICFYGWSSSKLFDKATT